MIFYREKLKECRINQRYSLVKFSKKIGVNKLTLWNWEVGRSTPKEQMVRLIADSLKIQVTEISDLKPDVPMNETDFTETIQSWLSIAESTDEQQEARFSRIINELNKLKGDLSQTKIIINALLFSMQTNFYIKDTKLRYLTASNEFLINISLPTEYKVFGHLDESFFSKKEAKINSDQDLKVITSGKPITGLEGLIPGSRRKKKCIISKIPLRDSNDNIIGVVGLFTDITAIKKEEKIRYMLENISNNIDEYLWIAGSRDKSDELGYIHNTFYYNDTYSKIIGISKEQLLTNNEHFKKLILPKYYPIIKETRTKCENTYPIKSTFQIKRFDTKKVRWIEEKIYRLDDIFYALGRDVTDKYNANYKREILEYALILTEEHIWVAKGLLKDSDGYFYLEETLYTLSGSRKNTFLGNMILSVHEEAKAWVNAVPAHAKKVFTENINGPYPIIRHYKIVSPFTKIELKILEKIYYDKVKDIFVGVIVTQ